MSLHKFIGAKPDVFISLGKPLGFDIFTYCFSTLFHRYLNATVLLLTVEKLFQSVLTRGYTCDLLLVLATQHPKSGPATVVEGDCKCSQLPPISATCCKRFNSMNILQHRFSDFVTEAAPGYTCNILVSRSLQHQKKVWCCQCQ